MIQSMTGYGAAQHVVDGVSYALEIRSLNNRYLKLSIKLPDQLQFLESEVDKRVRSRLARGSITYTLRVRSETDVNSAAINVDAVQRYVDQMMRIRLPDFRMLPLSIVATASFSPAVLTSSNRPLQAKEDSVGATFSPGRPDSPSISSSVIPSDRYSSSESPLRLTSGMTATDCTSVCV